MLKLNRWLLAIFLGTVILRLLLAFSIPNFTYDSYFHLRQAEQIRDTGIPLFEDELSYGGRSFRFLPLFHYFIALLALVFPLEIVAKITPNVLLASLTILVYLISIKLTSNETAAGLSACIAGLLPILYFTNSFSPVTLFLPLTFLTVYSFLNMEKRRFQYWYVASFILLTLTSPAAVLLLLGFFLYLLLYFLENKKLARPELELMFFSIIFFVWAQFLFFKEVLISEGIAFVWKNIPRQILQQYFPSVSIIEALVLVSIIPFLTGIFIVYRSLFGSKNEKVFLLISLVIATGIIGWLRLIPVTLFLSFLGIILSILFSLFYENLEAFISRTKWPRLNENLSLALFLLLFITMVFPAVNVASHQETPSPVDVAAFKWLRENTPQEAKVLALLEEGHMVTYYGHRKNVMDNNFNLVSDIEERYAHLNSLFTTKFNTLAVELFEKYGITHIMFTERAKKRLAQSNFQYITLGCYERLSDEQVKIYRVKCSLAETG